MNSTTPDPTSNPVSPEQTDPPAQPSVESQKEFFLKGINDVSEERLRQIMEKNYDSQNDDILGQGTLAAAGACYAIHAAWTAATAGTGDSLNGVPIWWPFAGHSWRPDTDPRKNLVKAAALLIAEIDKIDRKISV